MEQAVQEKYQKLCDLLREMHRVVVAFSAGVDSTLLLKVALDTLGRENVLAVTGVSASLASKELQSVKDLAALLDSPLELIETGELDNPSYAANPANRCYFCKGDLFARLTELAKARGYRAVLSGVNADDTGDWRPGIQAVQEHHVRSPLLEAGLSKAEVRELSHHLNLPTWQKPALACLASRIPYGTPITIQSLQQVEQAEAFLWSKGLPNLRVRHHQKLARIEVPVEVLPRLVQEPLRSEIIEYFKSLGYAYVTVDLQGFRSGSGNEVLGIAKR